MEDAKYREIFSGLWEHESPVDPGLWAGISAASAAAKTGLSISLLGKIAAGIAIAGGISAGVYFSLRDNAIVPSSAPLAKEVSTSASTSANEEITGSPEDKERGDLKSLSGASASYSDVGEEITGITNSSVLEEVQEQEQGNELQEDAVTGGVEEMTAPNEKAAAETARNNETADNAVNSAIEVDLLRHQDKNDPLLWMFSARGHEAAAYSWDFGDGSSMEGRRVTHRFRQSGTFEVCVKAEMPGSVESVKCTRIEASYDVKVVLPNIFSPGSSPGINDFYDLNMDESQHVTDYTLRIFTQDGQLVFESREGQKSWDGNNRFGEPMPVGIYLVMAEVKGPGGELVVERQTLTLNR